MKPPFLFFGAIAVMVFCSACNDEQEIKVYRVSREPSQPAAPDPSGMAAMPAMQGVPQPGMAAGSGPEIADTPPAHWERQAPSSMRQASYLVKDEFGGVADISLVVLGGAAGGALENVNRWAGQLGQPPMTEEQLKEKVQHVSSALGDVMVVDMEGLPNGGDALKDGRILAGIVVSDNRTVFFKMRGNAALVEAQKDGFVKWIGSVRFSEAGANPAAAAARTPAPAADSDKPQVKWEVPDGWKPVPASSMRYASFTVSGSNGEKGDISIIAFPGDSGGDLANVNRWRQQVGLLPANAAELEALIVPVKGRDAEILTVDLTGATSRILAGWARHEGRTWFFKLTGPDALVGGEKANFTKFLESVQFQP